VDDAASEVQRAGEDVAIETDFWVEESPASAERVANVADDDEIPESREGPSDGLRATAMLPFGPYIAAAGVITAFFGPQVAAWYLSILGL
jgi:hypothetical protein